MDFSFSYPYYTSHLPQHHWLKHPNDELQYVLDLTLSFLETKQRCHGMFPGHKETYFSDFIPYK
jgi:hypothetical protein